MPQNRVIKKILLYHILFWLVIFCGWYFFRYDDYYTRMLALEIIFIKVIFLAALVYTANQLLIPRLLYRKKYFLFTVFYLALIFSASILKMYIEGSIIYGSKSFSVWDDFKQRIYDNVIPHFLLVTTGAAFKLLYDYATAQKNLAEITKEKSEAELNFLKAQMNPHFLFNAINSVYFLIDKNNADARNALHKFSEMLRYQLYECNGQKIPVEKEIAFLKDYVAVQQLRIDDFAIVHFDSDESLGNLYIEPLLLLPFAENAFKHLSHYTNGDKNEIKINLSKNGSDQIRFSVFNTTEKLHENGSHHGIGLKNVKKRLELLYPQKHSLQIEREKDFFRVTLKLDVKN